MILIVIHRFIDITHKYDINNIIILIELVIIIKIVLKNVTFKFPSDSIS